MSDYSYMVDFKGLPYNYATQNLIYSMSSPSTVHSANTFLTQYFQRYLYNDFRSTLKWKLPDHWEQNYFETVLYCYGFVAVLKTDRFGVIPQQCGLKGYNVMYQPTKTLISSPFFKETLELPIGRMCTLLKLFPDYKGVTDLISYYADLMAVTAEAIGMNIFNSKLAYVFMADGKANAETFKELYDRVASGDPIVVTSKNLYDVNGNPNWMFFNQQLRNQYIAGDMLEDLRKIRREFLTMIGVPNANTEKKERLIVDEVNSNNDETNTLIDVILDSLNKSVKQTNEMFDTDISVTHRYRKKEGDNSARSNANTSGNV